MLFRALVESVLEVFSVLFRGWSGSGGFLAWKVNKRFIIIILSLFLYVLVKCSLKEILNSVIPICSPMV